MIKYLLPILFLATVFLPLTNAPTNSSYGVFLGASPSTLSNFLAYDEIVIDAYYYTKEQMTTLHDNDVAVYSYLNIGSIEEFRPYYHEFRDYTLGSYDNWPGEYWLDLSNIEIRDYTVDTLANTLVEKGVDGFFLDNIDVYYLYQRQDIYDGLLDIVTRLHDTYDLPIIMNGGYEFLQKATKSNDEIWKCLQGINHESIFTQIDFENNELRKNRIKARNYMLDYLSDMHEKGLRIYVIEYTKNRYFMRRIGNYYMKKGYEYYIADNIELQ